MSPQFPIFATPQTSQGNSEISLSLEGLRFKDRFFSALQAFSETFPRGAIIETPAACVCSHEAALPCHPSLTVLSASAPSARYDFPRVLPLARSRIGNGAFFYSWRWPMKWLHRFYCRHFGHKFTTPKDVEFFGSIITYHECDRCEHVVQLGVYRITDYAYLYRNADLELLERRSLH